MKKLLPAIILCLSFSVAVSAQEKKSSVTSTTQVTKANSITERKKAQMLSDKERIARKNAIVEAREKHIIIKKANDKSKETLGN